MAAKKPSPWLKEFGAEVTRIREGVGLTRTELATSMNVTRSYVGQVEAGTTRCRRDFAMRLDSALNSGSTLLDKWEDCFRSVDYPRWFVGFLKAEETATLLRVHENTLVYELFQTEAYARALLLTDDLLTGRTKRQATLTRSDSPMVFVVMNESVLYRQVGCRETMRKQLEYLITVSGWNNVTLQIAPTTHYHGVNGSFTVATQRDGNEVVYLATAIGGSVSKQSDDILHVAKLFATLQAHALPVGTSRDLIQKVTLERWACS
ncbi:XRE family transcriptional regulator [Actinomadura craniellae]|uniref:XRE family transcriptional regulator n=1 Tax=Actinomadura craniellae TaxID=2231787 RepID=A0A365H3Q0_9ACTN|nr:helix-turn-helix transcriptional regulator [Actinomadura craniellae]RAY13735.1 XRE family transcriptional regulator [Actinomadura craniellae]